MNMCENKVPLICFRMHPLELVLLLILLFLCQPWALELSCDPSVVESEVNQTAELKCQIRNIKNEIIMIVWTKDGAVIGERHKNFRRRRRQAQDSKYNFVEQKENQTVSLEVKNVQTSDSGKYECMIFTDEQHRIKEINLKVQESDQLHGSNSYTDLTEPVLGSRIHWITIPVFCCFTVITVAVVLKVRVVVKNSESDQLHVFKSTRKCTSDRRLTDDELTLRHRQEAAFSTDVGASLKSGQA